MDYFWVIIFIVLAIIFRSHVWAGLLFAFFGAIVAEVIFGDSDFTTIVGAALGFWLGIVSSHSAEENDDEVDGLYDNIVNKKIEKTQQTPNPHQSTGITRCPTCQRKIRIKLPLSTDKGKCKSCSSIFHIRLDKTGYLKTELITPQQNKKDQGGQPTTIEDCYKTLNITPDTPPDAVKEAYRKKIFQYHPDLVMKLGEKVRKLADTESRAINAAYSILKSKGLAH